MAEFPEAAVAAAGRAGAAGRSPILEAIRYALRRSVLQRTLPIAAVVGTLHVANNVYDALSQGPYTARLAAKIFVDYFIPFAVASAGAAANRER